MKKKVDLIGVGVHVSTVWSHNEQKEGEGAEIDFLLQTWIDSTV